MCHVRREKDMPTCPNGVGRDLSGLRNVPAMPYDRLVRLPPRGSCRRLLSVAVALLALLIVPGSALADDAIDLDRAERQRDEAAARRDRLQGELDVLLSRIEDLKVAREQQEQQIKRLTQEVTDERERAQAARARVADHYRKAYQSGGSNDSLAMLFDADSVEEVNERSRVLGLLAADSEREREAAEGASLRSAALAEQLEQATAALAEQEDELARAEEEAAQKVAAAQEDVEQLDEEISAEKRRRAEAARRRAAARAGSGGGGGGGSSSGPAPVNGGVACPVGTPRNYSDTYGAARSGGRVHMGVDILAPSGTPIYAYENGVISRMSNNSLGGITLYLEGDSGNLYYYAHLSGYASGISTGSRVTAGQHIALNGMTGNAPVPHLHWEVMLGGGSNVNPYPYALQACG
jgi:murein DD-endopeptidase MepM/ murein hydrolase activator NlpD